RLIVEHTDVVFVRTAIRFAVYTHEFDVVAGTAGDGDLANEVLTTGAHFDLLTVRQDDARGAHLSRKSRRNARHGPLQGGNVATVFRRLRWQMRERRKVQRDVELFDVRQINNGELVDFRANAVTLDEVLNRILNIENRMAIIRLRLGGLHRLTLPVLL